MAVLKKDIKVSNQNKLTSYFPIRTSTKEGSFDWDVAQGIVVRNVYKKEVSRALKGKIKDGDGNAIDSSLKNFSDICRKDFDQRLDERELWSYIEEMYFSGDTIYQVAPESLLFKITSLPSGSSKHLLGDMFSSLMQGFNVINPVRIERNFIEQQVVDSLRSAKVLEDYDGRRLSKNINENPYLPFLTKYFKKDLNFLTNHPRYLIDNLKELLKLYGYLYTAQLSLNINGWTAAPTVKPLYFILENETASKERSGLLVKNGHQNVAKSFKYLFPYLTISESLQQMDETDKKNNKNRLPLWELASRLTEDDTLAIKTYTMAFAEDRNRDSEYNFPYDENEGDPQTWLKALLELSVKQFDKGQTREAAQGKFIKSIEQELCGAFVKSRGQTGKVLVMNQDYLALLTNLAIGDNEKLRFHELLEEFRARGVYFDKQTQQSLIRFYERVGNVERMSDSGDAVYVRKTV